MASCIERFPLVAQVTVTVALHNAGEQIGASRNWLGAGDAMKAGWRGKRVMRSRRYWPRCSSLGLEMLITRNNADPRTMVDSIQNCRGDADDSQAKQNCREYREDFAPSPTFTLQ